MSPTMIRLVLIDSHLVVREGIKAVLGAHPGLYVVGEVGNVRIYVTRAREMGKILHENYGTTGQ